MFCLKFYTFFFKNFAIEFDFIMQVIYKLFRYENTILYVHTILWCIVWDSESTSVMHRHLSEKSFVFDQPAACWISELTLNFP